MLIELEPATFTKVQTLLAASDIFLAARAAVKGRVPASVFVADGAQPTAALVRAGHRLHLAGRADDPVFNQGLGRLFAEQIYPVAREAGEAMFVLYYREAGWGAVIEDVLAGKFPLWGVRHYYEFQGPAPDWHRLVRTGFDVRTVDAALLAQRELKNHDRLVDEVMAEGPSIAHYLENRFGTCMVWNEETLAGWCLSEFNVDSRCEVGIETVEGFQRQGVATVLTGALVEQAGEQGYRRIGWHCWADNVGSVRTALRAGFVKRADYSVHYAWYDPAINLGVHGNRAFEREAYGEALGWYRQAMEQKSPPAWVFWNAACAAARSGERRDAFRLARAAVAHGFQDVEQLRQSPYFAAWKHTAEWNALLHLAEAANDSAVVS